MRKFLLDLGIGDVHTPGSIGESSKREREAKMADISTKTRNALPADKFAWPEKRKFPIHDAAHVRNAAARLAQTVKAGRIDSATASKIRSRIAAAGKRFGVEVTSSDTAQPRGKRLQIQADLAHGGSLHVRHVLSGKDLTYFADNELAVTLDDKDDAKPVWIQVAKQGAFAGHPAGPFELSAQVFSDIIRNFQATANRAIPIDYEHASEADPTSGSIPTTGAPAQGWIRDLKIEGGNLYGLVEWGAQAREQIRSGGYKFLSPAIRFGAKDRVTGKNIGARLTSAALTNEPFLDGMKPLAAKDSAKLMSHPADNRPSDTPDHVTAIGEAIGSLPDDSRVDSVGEGRRESGITREVPAAEAGPYTLDANLHPKQGPMERGMERPAHAPGEYMPKIRMCLGLHPMASAKECADTLDTLRDHCMKAGNPFGQHEGVDLSTYTKPLREMTGASPGATWDEVFDTVEDLIHAAITEHIIEDHGGQAAMADEDEEEELTMADKEAIALKDTEIGTLKVSLKDAQDKLTAAEGELKALREDKAKRDEADAERDVCDAISVYGKQHNLSAEKDKSWMLTLRKADPAGFTKKFAPVAPEQRYLMSELAGGGKRPVTEDPFLLDDKGQPLGYSALVSKLMTQKKLSYADAQNEAAKILNPSQRRVAG